MTDHDWIEYQKFVEKMGTDRRRTLPEEFSPACFLAGAMCHHAFLNRYDKIPGKWTIPVMFGRGSALLKIFTDRNMKPPYASITKPE